MRIAVSSFASLAMIEKRSVPSCCGRACNRASIGMAVAMRDVQRHLRETGESRGFNPAFTQRDRSQFLQGNGSCSSFQHSRPRLRVDASKLVPASHWFHPIP
ncbi:MAG TPA: DUF188 domain-containing protein [Hyphomicrobium sp.]|nr:DUF188 domain-containing protein [Hyphomicrobium sp.]